MKSRASLQDFALDGDLYASRSSSMRKAVHHLRRPVAIKRTWVDFSALSPPAVFDGTLDSYPSKVRTKLKNL
jgi:hypothetical protein